MNQLNSPMNLVFSEINFLDTTVKFNEHRELITTLYNKPTDTHLYLEYSLAHPSTVLEKGPYGQYLRLRRICTLDKDFKTNAFKLTGYYLKRGYPASSLKNISIERISLNSQTYWRTTQKRS